MEKVLALLEAAETPRNGRQLLEAFAAPTAVCESHLLVALQRLHRGGKIRVPGRATAGDLTSAELLSLGFVSAAKPWILNGRWKILDRIGEGGMSTVYKAEQLTLGGRFVAVKVNSVAGLDPAVREEVRKRAEREARILASLSHPNIVEIYDGGTEGDQWYTVMKYLSGGTLVDLMKAQGGRIPWRKALGIAIDLADALAAAAAKGILHRDIKPENVMFDDQGIVRITDFGLAKPTSAFAGRTAEGDGVTRIQALRGSVQWMAPERWENLEPAEGSEAADIYSFGQMLRYVLAGEHPYAFPSGGSRLLQWHKHHVDTVPKPLLEALPECNREFAESIDRMIRKRPEDRYRTFQKMSADLRRIASRLPRPTTTVIGRPATAIARPKTRISEIRQHDTALADFLNLLEIDIAKLDHALQEEFGDLGTNPRLLRAVWQLSQDKKAVPYAAALWAEAEAGRRATDFEGVYLASLEAFEQGAEGDAADPAVPLDPCRLLWMGFRKIERERRDGGAWGDTTALEGLLEFLGSVLADPSLNAFRNQAPASPALAARPESPASIPLQEPEAIPESKPDSRSRILVPIPAPAAAPTSDAGSLVGRTIDHYHIQEKIGEGGMGTVYLAHDLTLDRPVALKILHERFEKQPAFVQRFIREAQLAGKLTHPNLVTCYRAGDDHGFVWYVMEYVSSRTTLADHLEKRGRMGLVDALRTGLEAAMGLHAIHSHGWVHRDIKPDNLMVLLGPDGEVAHIKILDAGLVRPVDDSKAITTDQLFVGTPEYASPEQLQEKSVDARSDLYQLGVILYECLAGGKDARPYSGTSKTPFLLKTADPDAAPIPLRERNPEIPQEVADLVHRLLAKDPANRFQSAAETVTALEEQIARLERGELVSARAGKGPRALVVSALASLALLFGIIYFLSGRTPRKETQTAPSFEIARKPDLPAPKDPAPAPPLPPAPSVQPISKDPSPSPEKLPDLRLPTAEEIPPSPPKPLPLRAILVGHEPDKRELGHLEELLGLSRASLPLRSAYEFQEALARLLAWRASRAQELTPWLLVLADAEIERIGAGFQAFKARPLFRSGAGEIDLVLRSGRTLHGKLVDQDARELTIEPEGSIRQPVSMGRISPLTFPVSSASGLSGILVRSAAGDALGCLPKLADLDEEDRLRLLPLLLDQAIEELFLGAEGTEGIRTLAGTPLPEPFGGAFGTLPPKRLRQLQEEKEAAGLYGKRPSLESERKLLSEYPGTRAAAAVAHETLAAFRKAIPEDGELARIQKWGAWTPAFSTPSRCSFTLDPDREDYKLEALGTDDWAWASRDHEGSKSGYMIDWSFGATSPEGARFWVQPFEKLRIEIGKTTLVIRSLVGEAGKETEKVLLSRDHASIAGGKVAVIPHEGISLLFLGDAFVSSLPRPELGLPGKIQLGIAGGSALIHSVRVVDPNAR